MTHVMFNPYKNQTNSNQHVTTSHCSPKNAQMSRHFSHQRHQQLTNIMEFEDRYEIHLTVAGFDKSEIEVALVENKMTVKGKKEWQTDQKFVLKEAHFSNFEKVFYLPKDTDYEHIEAKTVDGMLTIQIKKTEKALPKKVNIV